MNKFHDGQKIETVYLADGTRIRIAEGAERSLVVLGRAKEMTIVMQPSHGGLAPWICVESKAEN